MSKHLESYLNKQNNIVITNLKTIQQSNPNAGYVNEGDPCTTVGEIKQGMSQIFLIDRVDSNGRSQYWGVNVKQDMVCNINNEFISNGIRGFEINSSSEAVPPISFAIAGVALASIAAYSIMRKKLRKA